MLLETLIKKLEAEFSSLQFVVDKQNHTITIPPTHKEFGHIEIEDDGDEFIVFVGNFTHWHANCYIEGLSDEKKAEVIAEEVVEFLHDLLNDKIVLWGSHRGGGGFCYRDEEQSQKSYPEKTYQTWLWSGLFSG